MKQNVWEFLRKHDGTYAVSHGGNLLSDSIPEERLEHEICVRFGFCGQEYDDIRSHLTGLASAQSIQVRAARLA
jgi:hypothetical protein